MRIGSLFSGIGGLELGLERSGIGRTVWQVEIDPFCRSVLAKHWPNVTRYEDVLAATKLPRVDLICGGFPCQDVSSAGNRAGLAGRRSGLWREFARVVSEVRPEWVVVENVASGAKLWLDAVVCDLGERGYACLPLPLSAAGVGAPHLRRRIFVVARLADAERELVREQSGRIGGSRRAGQALAPEHGEGGAAADADPQGQYALAVDAEVAGASEIARNTESGRLCTRGDATEENRCQRWVWNGSPDTGWGPPEPCLRRVDDGLPGRSHATNRLRALGNAVVPQCAEVVGHVIRELMR